MLPILLDVLEWPEIRRTLKQLRSPPIGKDTALCVSVQGQEFGDLPGRTRQTSKDLLQK